MGNADHTPDPQWLAARLELMAKEKQLTRVRDELAAMRRAMPRRKIERDYTFSTPSGPARLADLFGGHSQLLVYHFMFGPDWETGCPSCSFWADHFDAMVPHLAQRDVAFAVVSRAPLATLTAFAERMGWKFSWVSSAQTEFNHDFAVSFSPEEVDSKALVYNFGTQPAHGQELPGASAFIKEDGDVFHSYSTYTRGLDALNGTYQWLDLAPKGRDESELPWPMAWVKRHDEYAD